MNKPKKSNKTTFSISKSRLLPLVFLLIVMTPVIILARENERIRKQELMRVYPTPTPSFRADEDVVWSNIQQWRANNKKKQYVENDVLCNYAIIRLKQTGANWSQTGFEQLSGEIQKNGNFSKVGENIANDLLENSQYMSRWLSHLSSKQNLDADYSQSCLKCENTRCVQLFANKSTTTNPVVLTNNPTVNPWLVEKVDEITTDARMPKDERMATADELFTAINNYRASHGVGVIEKHQTLCNIAQTRANQLLKLGELDNHEGMESLAKSQSDFDNMGEILQGGVQPNLAVHVVEWGWGRSLTGHKESMLNKKWTHGCGGVAGYFSVFSFGSN